MAILLIACEQTAETSELNKINQKTETQDVLNFLFEDGFDTTGVIITGDELIIEGDIAFRISDMKKRMGSLNKQWATEYTVSDSKVRDIKVLIDPNLNSYWAIKTREAMEVWNNVPNSKVNFREVSNNQDIRVYHANVGSATAEFPTSTGAVGFQVRVDPSFRKSTTMIHELGHCIGLRHDFARDPSRPWELKEPSVKIEGTPDRDYKSIMSYHSDRYMTDNDKYAVQVLYPDIFVNELRSHNGIIGYDLSVAKDKIISLDYNGDGKEDIITYRPGYKIVFMGRSNGDGTFTRVVTSRSGIIGFDMTRSVDQLISLDYNGDGKDDLIAYRPGKRVVFMGRSNGDGTFTRVVTSRTGIIGFDMTRSEDQLISLDYNGDGKDDLIAYRPGHGVVFMGRSNGNGTFTRVVTSRSGIIGFDMTRSIDRLIALDYNGDGKDDLIAYRGGHGVVFMGKSNGNGTFTRVITSRSGIIGFDMTRSIDQLISLDYNGDGKDDLIAYRPGHQVVFMGRSNGNGTFTRVLTSRSGIIGFDMKRSVDGLISLDYNSDGSSDLLAYRPGLKVAYLGKSIK